jgi:hypothetical protein
VCSTLLSTPAAPNVFTTTGWVSKGHDVTGCDSQPDPLAHLQKCTAQYWNSSIKYIFPKFVPGSIHDHIRGRPPLFLTCPDTVNHASLAINKVSSTFSNVAIPSGRRALLLSSRIDPRLNMFSLLIKNCLG